MTKTIAGVICGVLMAFLVSTAVRATATPEWIVLDKNPDSQFSYDKAGVTTPKKGVIRIKARVVYTEEGKEDAIQTLQPATGYDNLSTSHYVYDLDCKGRKSKLLSVAHFDESGTQIKEFELSDVTNWEDVLPEARQELILELVCNH